LPFIQSASTTSIGGELFSIFPAAWPLCQAVNTVSKAFWASAAEMSVL
jgi:hypothetical protein